MLSSIQCVHSCAHFLIVNIRKPTSRLFVFRNIKTRSVNESEFVFYFGFIIVNHFLSRTKSQLWHQIQNMPIKNHFLKNHFLGIFESTHGQFGSTNSARDDSAMAKIVWRNANNLMMSDDEIDVDGILWRMVWEFNICA